MHIFITGGAGYIGSVLVGKLLNEGYKVTVLDNFRYSQNSLATHFINPKLVVVKGDVRDVSLVRKLSKGCDVIIPLAAIVGAPACDADPIGATSVNKDSILALLDEISTEQWIIMPTTNSAYGKSPKGEYVDEESPLQPLSLYARDKVDVEKRLMENSKATSLRLATVFGMSPRMRVDLLVNNFVKAALNPGYIVLYESHYRRNFIHIQDVANAFILALKNPDKFQGNIFNLGLSEANLTKLQLAEKVKSHIKEFTIVESNIGADIDQRDYLVSNQKIEKYGFSPSVSLDNGIIELIQGLSTLKIERYTNL